MNEIEKAMCEAIAKYTPFSADDIYSAWLSFHSFDLILRSIEFARVSGITSISRAMDFLVEDYFLEQREHRLEKRTKRKLPIDFFGNIITL